jgi:hypothetical protein
MEEGGKERGNWKLDDFDLETWGYEGGKERGKR